MFTRVFVPGYGNSINGHWQEAWCKQSSNSYWAEQQDWDNPHCEDWVEVLNTLIQSIEGPILLVTHSLGGSTLIEWSKKYHANILGALIVAIPDVQSDYFPPAILGYQRPPLEKLPFPSLILASENDPYCSLNRAKYFAQNWGSSLINVGHLGHINTASNIGEWSEGKDLLNKFIDSLTLPDVNRS